MTATIRAVIVEDEPHARALLRSMIAAHSEIEVVGEAEDGRAAVRAITGLRPDLVFLDVQIPELNAFEVLETLDLDPLPAVIFVTAFDQYALRAFDVRAIDYVLKPFDAERVERAVARAVEQLERVGAAEMSRRLSELLVHIRGNGVNAVERIPVKADGRVRFVDVADVDWIEADDHVLRIHSGKDAHIVRDTLANMEGRLDPTRFIRIHRAIVVNVRRIREVQPWFQGDFVIVLQDGTKLTSGRSYRENVRRLLDV